MYVPLSFDLLVPVTPPLLAVEERAIFSSSTGRCSAYSRHSTCARQGHTIWVMGGDVRNRKETMRRTLCDHVTSMLTTTWS